CRDQQRGGRQHLGLGALRDGQPDRHRVEKKGRVEKLQPQERAEQERVRAVVLWSELPGQLDVDQESAEADDSLVDQRPRRPEDVQLIQHWRDPPAPPPPAASLSLSVLPPCGAGRRRPTPGSSAWAPCRWRNRSAGCSPAGAPPSRCCSWPWPCRG